MALKPGTRIHFVGVAGIGMSGLAHICHDRGFVISGCDSKIGGPAKALAKRGVPMFTGHHPNHLDGSVDLVVHSSAVHVEEPELHQAKARGIRTISRGELLAELAEECRLIGVAGAHGKTTTSGMAGTLLCHAGWDPTVVVGGVMLAMGTNARAGKGRFFVAETDESDGSFLHLHPEVAIITNIDREHLNHYRSLERLVEAFQRFVRQIRPGGTLISCYDDPRIRRVLAHPHELTYGFDPAADITAQRISPPDGAGVRFRASYRGRSLGAFRLQVPGRHNISNALGVIGLGLILDLPLNTIREALAEFGGTQRRFQVLRLPGDINFIEDYAHHPSEIEATLAADSTRSRHRLVIFQPHRFSRTQSLEQEFSGCFDRADGVIVTDIYAAFEQPIPGVTGERLARLIRAHGHPHVRYVPKPELARYVQRVAKAGDTIFFLGAGDIGELCHGVARQLDATQRAAE
ncbi:MAG: UDP-N-acetylmuramate--L-alanine ligase [Candidatus Omnitrophica bacterium]|nr:UDP-N-acetylmuramate--L-alanine ligase [Candidatus Omnitrophota bacterium]